MNKRISFSLNIAFCLVLMCSLGNVYFKWHKWTDYQKYAPEQSEALRQKRLITDTFQVLDSAQVIYFQALNESNWFGAAEHDALWQIVHNVVQDIKGIYSCKVVVDFKFQSHNWFLVICRVEDVPRNNVD